MTNAVAIVAPAVGILRWEDLKPFPKGIVSAKFEKHIKTVSHKECLGPGVKGTPEKTSVATAEQQLIKKR